MEAITNFILQIKGLLTTATVIFGFIYLVRSGALAEITGSYKRMYEAVAKERDELKIRLTTQESIKDAKIKELDDYIKILVLDSKTRMEIELQKHA